MVEVIKLEFDEAQLRGIVDALAAHRRDLDELRAEVSELKWRISILEARPYCPPPNNGGLLGGTAGQPVQPSFDFLMPAPNPWPFDRPPTVLNLWPPASSAAGQ